MPATISSGKTTKMAKNKTISLIIKTELTNEQILQIFNNGTKNLEDLGMQLLEIRVVGSAVSLVKGICYGGENDTKRN